MGREIESSNKASGPIGEGAGKFTRTPSEDSSKYAPKLFDISASGETPEKRPTKKPTLIPTEVFPGKPLAQASDVKETSEVRTTHGAKETFKDTEKSDTEVIRGTLMPHMTKEQGFKDIHEEGTLGETGVTAKDSEGNIVGAVRHPTWIVTETKQKDGYIEVTFGGEPTKDTIERSLLRQFGNDGAAAIAQELVAAAKESPHLPYHASTRGSEVESFLIDDNGSVVAAAPGEQEELIAGIHETALDPAPTLEEGIVDRALHTINNFNPSIRRLNTSVPMVGMAEKGQVDSGLQINNGSYEMYVAGLSKKLRETMGRHDEQAGQIGDFVAQKYGFSTFEELVKNRPDVDYWTNAAGHHSVSLPHVSQNGEYVVPTEIAVAASDMLSTDMAKVSGLLMYSSPLMYGEMPEVDGKHPLDVRDIYRYTMSTSLPGDLIRDPKTLHNRIQEGIVNGKTYTIDRTAYTSTAPDGTKRLSYHGPVRLRMAAPSTGNVPIGRVESTESGSSFSLLDEYARNVVLDAMKLGAFEASAHGEHPADYFGDRYPSLAGNDRRMDIGKGYNLNGPTDPLAGEVIEETLGFLDEMADKYPPYRDNINFAKSRIANLRLTATAQNFEEYEQNPIGTVSQVMQNMYRAGSSPLEIVQAVTEYELHTAQAIVAAKGDMCAIAGIKK